MKKYLIVLTALCMALCLAFASFADDTLQNEILGYGSLSSSDVLTYNPENEVVAKDVIATSSRLHQLFATGSITLPDEWDFETYFTDYFVANGLNGGVSFTSETNTATRAQVVVALYNAILGKVDLAEINEVLDILDVDPNASYYTAVSKFMKAGIIEGADEYGTFNPENSVKAYELSEMIDRILNTEERVQTSYVVYSSDEPFYLIDDFLLHEGANGWKNGGSGWRVDYTGSAEIGTINNYGNVLRDYSSTDNMSTSRKIHTQEDGNLVFESVYKFESGNTVGFAFIDTDGNEVIDAGWKNGKAYMDVYTSNVNVSEVTGKGTVDGKSDYYLSGLVRTRIDIDLDNGKYKLWMGNKYIGEREFTAKNIAKVKIFTGIEEFSSVEIKNTHLYKNYKVNDVFRLEDQGQAPVGYETVGNVTVERINSNANNTNEVNSMKMVTTAGNTTSAKRSFDKAHGKVVTEVYVLLNDGTSDETVQNSAYYTLTCDGTAVLTIKNEGNNWYAGTTALRSFTSNVWQLLRIEADTSSQTATIKINGKVVATSVPFLVKADGFDGLEVGVEATSADTVWFDDFEVYETFDYDDYCPEPTPLDTGDYILNMSVCNLWRNGSHYGWDWIRPYAELQPVTGYYDEGIPEAMDWEIKYLVEHGISNYMTCWYPLTSTDNAPLKKPRMVDAIHDGYFNAKYSDMMTFSLMFENSGYNTTNHLSDFKNHVFPMWLDWYFSDDRYCRIEEDGKKYIFLTIYQYENWKNMAGGTEAAGKELINWMKQQVVSAGLADGMIVCFGGSMQTAAAYKSMANMGGDGVILYTWGSLAKDIETQKTYSTQHTATAKSNGISLLTLASAGFNNVGWTTIRKGYMTTDEFETMLKWHKSQMNTNYGSDADSWKSRLITFDTWNEYGEGHYFYPTAGEYKNEGYGGFGFLDVIAEVFGGVERGSAEAEANNTVPTATQKARIGHLYPDDNDHYIRRDSLVESETVDNLKVIEGYGFSESKTENSTVLSAFQKSLGTSGSVILSNNNWSSLGGYGSNKKFFKFDSSKGAYYGKTASTAATISFGESKGTNGMFSGLNMDEVKYIRLKLGTSSGGSVCKIYFSNTTDTSQYTDGYLETRTFQVNTYIDGSDSCTYLIDTSTNSLWTGTLKNLRIDPTQKSGETVYIYSLEFLTVDETKIQPTIVVDGRTYTEKDYNEMRSFDRNEIYTTPTEEGGLYKLLHIVYEWSRDSDVLKLDTPNGTTFEFTVGSKTALVNGKSVTLDKTFELYDNAPVIPLLFILKNAGYVYAYDFTNKKLDITVAETFKLVDGITNGNAEGDEMSFTGYNNSETEYISIVADPENSRNHVWKRTSKTGKAWNYFSTPFTFVAGKTYTLDFDVYLDSLSDGTTPTSNGALAVNPRYSKGSGVVDNNVRVNVGIVPKTWTHITHTFTVSEDYDGTAGQLSIYMDPLNELGCTFLVDNFVLRCEPKAFSVVNGDAEGSETSAFRSGDAKDTVSIKTESNGNKYWDVKAGWTTQHWTYMVQDTKFEKGVTYYYSVRAKLGTDGNGNSITTDLTLNARYYDFAQLNNTGEWYAHTYKLSDSDGVAINFKTGDDWVTCTGSFTISQGYEPNGGPNGNVPEQITFFANPKTDAGVSFMIDDFQISTDPDAFK